jgi:hypothetical protein
MELFDNQLGTAADQPVVYDGDLQFLKLCRLAVAAECRQQACRTVAIPTPLRGETARSKRYG